MKIDWNYVFLGMFVTRIGSTIWNILDFGLNKITVTEWLINIVFIVILIKKICNSEFK